ncbi:MAG: FKBP-type peptidyl-prolyl cis-trans isomerase [Parasphingorhabdus sp.]|jgi:FKBP-type peptidyl-prolyl cis-trans isomerase
MSIRLRQVLVGSCLLTLVSAPFADEMKLESDEQKFSYSMGFAIGSQILGQFGGADASLDVVARAISDALLGATPLLSQDEVSTILQAEQEKVKVKEEAAAADAKAKGANALALGEAFLAENGKKDGVITTDSGLQYMVLTAGEGVSPSTSDTVVVDYAGTLLDGTEFDSSIKRGTPATFSLGGIIPGWQEALQLMNKGAKWKVFIPSTLAYGANGAGGLIGPNETLIFEIELIEIK